MKGNRVARERFREASWLDRVPFADPAVDRLPDALRAGMGEHWKRRARSEAHVGHSLRALIPRLRAVGAEPIVLEWLEVSATDEALHSELCRRLAERYAGTRVEPVELSRVELPRFGCDDERLEILLLVAGTCCINETLATAWLEANLADSSAPIARAANRIHLRDEVDHARIGWAHLASLAVDDDLRDALAECVPRLLAANVPIWLRRDEFLPVDGVPGHGLCSHAVSTKAIERAVHELVLPGFRYVGVRVESAELSRVAEFSRATAQCP